MEVQRTTRRDGQRQTDLGGTATSTGREGINSQEGRGPGMRHSSPVTQVMHGLISPVEMRRRPVGAGMVLGLRRVGLFLGINCT